MAKRKSRKASASIKRQAHSEHESVAHEMREHGMGKPGAAKARGREAIERWTHGRR